MSQTAPSHKSLVPTIGLAIGMLVGGLIAAVVGALLGSESAVVMLYAVGTITGAIVGSLVATRWQAPRPSPDCGEVAAETNSTIESQPPGPPAENHDDS